MVEIWIKAFVYVKVNRSDFRIEPLKRRDNKTNSIIYRVHHHPSGIQTYYYGYIFKSTLESYMYSVHSA